MDQMAEDYARYMHEKRLLDDARRALDALLADDGARRRIGHTQEGMAAILAEKFGERSAHIVAVWD